MNGLPRADWRDGDFAPGEALDGGVLGVGAEGKGQESRGVGWVVLAPEALVPRGASAGGPLAGGVMRKIRSRSTHDAGRRSPARLRVNTRLELVPAPALRVGAQMEDAFRVLLGPEDARSFHA